MNGDLVGELSRSRTGVLSFQYNSQWLDNHHKRPISLSLPLQNEPYIGDKVYNFFDNLLPDNPAIRGRIQARFMAETNQPFELLSHIGKDCVGALQLSDKIETDVKKIVGAAVTDSDIAKTLKNYQQAPLGMSHSEDDFRISIAGAQEKSAFLWHENKWKRPFQSTPTTHIFKLPIGKIPYQQIDLSDSCENEWICTQIAKAFGLDTANCKIIHFEDVKTLVVERFDRKFSGDNSWIIRLPQEDMCQAMGYSPSLKYQSDGGPGILNIMDLLLGSQKSKHDQEHFLKSQVLFWLLAAIDGHAKNFSLFIEALGRYQATPLYDIMSAYPIIYSKQMEKQKIKMAMSLKGKNNHYAWHKIQPRHFVSTAEFANFSAKRAKKIVDDMLMQIDEVIDAVGNILPKNFPDRIATPIFEGMKKLRN